MSDPRDPVAPPSAHVPSAVDDAFSRFLPQAWAIIGTAYVGLAILHAVRGTPLGWGIAWINTVTAIPAFALALAVKRRPPAAEHVPYWNSALGAVVLANATAGLVLHPAPTEATGLQVVAVAGGYFLARTWPYVGLLVADFAIFGAAYAFGLPDPQWGEAFVRLLAFSATGLFLHTGRRRQIARIEALRQENLARARALDASEERFRTVAENARDIVSVLDDTNRFLYVSSRVREVLGYEPSELVGSGPDVLVEPDDLRAAAAAGSSAWAGANGATTLRARCKDGSTRLLEVTGCTADFGGQRCVVIVARDVTDRRALEDRLREAQKHESLSVMAGGIAHDFNNLLTVILGEAELARAVRVEMGVALEQIADAARRAQRLTSQLLAYAGGMPREERTLDLAAQVEGVVELLRSSIAAHTELRFEFEPGPPAVRADPGQLQQLVMNLVLNGSESRGGAPVHVTVSVRTERLGAREAGALLPAQERGEGRYAVLEVRDDGDGVPVECLGRIFDPFFTTKRAGRGLGLAAVLGVARAHGAGLRVETKPGQGCSFSVYFPACESSPEPCAERGTPPPTLRAGTALVVDDEDAVRRVMARSLRHLGLEPLEAASGEEAVVLLEGGLPELLIAVVDLSMPGIDGLETRRRLRALRNDLPVLVTSGFDRPGALAVGEESGADFLSKPFSQAQLAERVHELLGTKS